jgi:hypothetical protein
MLLLRKHQLCLLSSFSSFVFLYSFLYFPGASAKKEVVEGYETHTLHTIHFSVNVSAWEIIEQHERPRENCYDVHIFLNLQVLRFSQRWL